MKNAVKLSNTEYAAETPCILCSGFLLFLGSKLGINYFMCVHCGKQLTKKGE